MGAHFRMIVCLALAIAVVVPTSCVAASVGRCQGDEYYVVPDGRDYRGSVNTTTSGIPCQSWGSQSPHPHDTTVPNPSLGIGFNNYCRNPFMDTTVGCFTTDPNVRYQLCDIGPPCTTATAAPRSFVISPSNGSRVPYGSYATMSCTPTPCDIYFTNGSRTPTKASSLYGHAIALLTNQTLSAVAYFSDGSILYASSSVWVSAQDFFGSLFPAPGLYTSPILLFVLTKGSIQQSSMVLLVGNQTVPMTGNGTWLSTTGDVSVVQGNTLLVTGRYVFQLPSPLPPTVYPQSGTFWGGVKVLIFPLKRIKSILFALNSTQLRPLDGSTVSIHVQGVTTLHLLAQYIDGTSAASTFQYDVLLAWAPKCSPPPGAYTAAINITCGAPKGASALLTLPTSMPSTALFLGTPGSYDVTASYVDDSFVSVNSTMKYVLAAAPVASPFASSCGSRVVANDLVVAATIPANTTLSLTAVNGTVVQRAGGAVILSGDCNSPGACFATAFLTAVPVDNEMLRSSNTTACAATFYPRGNLSTASYRVQTTIDASLLAACLLFAKTELIEISATGPYNVARVTQLPSALVSQYDASLRSCLSAMTDGEVKHDGSFSLVTRYTANTTSTTVQTGVSLQLFGWNVRTSVVKLVPVSLACSDIGAPIVVQHDMSALFAPTGGMARGMYRMCAVTDGNAYSVQGPIINVLPLLRTAAVVPCGGVLDTPFKVVTINEHDGTLVSVNGGPWQSAATYTINALDAPTVISAVNGEDVKQCVFRPVTSPPDNAAYRVVPLTGGIALSLSVSVDKNAALDVSIRSQNCSTDAVFVASAVATAGTVVPDELVPMGVVPPDAAVCLSDGQWTTQLWPSGIALSPHVLQLIPCENCTTGLCFSNHTCACAGPAREPVHCATTPGDDNGGSTLTTLRVVLLMIYVLVVVAVWIAVRRHESQAKH